MLKKELYALMAALSLLLVSCHLQPNSRMLTLPDPVTPKSSPKVTFVENHTASFSVKLGLTLEPIFAHSITGQASQETANELWQLWQPGFLVYSLQNYPLAKRADEAQLFIYRIKDIEGESKHSADNIANLRRLLQDKPALGAYPRVGLAEPANYVPWLRPINARPMMHAGVTYLDFQNGAGMRYLTQYAQALSVVNNAELYYTFQGLTQNGQYYIAAVLPVHHSALLADAHTAPDGDAAVWMDLAKNLQYMRKMAPLLDEAAPSSFTPNLANLDAMMRSISVDSLSTR